MSDLPTCSAGVCVHGSVVVAGVQRALHGGGPALHLQGCQGAGVQAGTGGDGRCRARLAGGGGRAHGAAQGGHGDGPGDGPVGGAGVLLGVGVLRAGREWGERAWDVRCTGTGGCGMRCGGIMLSLSVVKGLPLKKDTDGSCFKEG